MKNARQQLHNFNHYINVFICCIICFFLIFISFPFNLVFAENSSDEFKVIYSPSSLDGRTEYTGYTLAVKSSTREYFNAWCNYDNFYGYTFLVPYDLQNSQYNVYYVLDYNLTYPNDFSISRSFGNSSSTFSISNFNTDQTSNLLYINDSLTQRIFQVQYANVYSDLATGLAAIKDYIDNGGNTLPNDGFDGTLNIPAGNVAYIQINGGDMELSAVMNSKSGIIMGGNAWANNARISYGVNNYPSSGTTFPLSGSDLIPWMKQAQGQDLLGRTRYAGYPRSGLTTSDNFIVIYNPASSSLASKGFDDGVDELNPSITAHFSKLVTYRIFPLTQSYNVQTNELTSNSISDYDDYFNGTPDENGQFIETPSSPGMPSQVQPGGTGGLSDSSQSIGDYIRNITNILSNFVNNVIALIQVPISHIGQLIDSGSGFMSALRGLYAWLPVDIQGLVISALTVVIGIGVFKVFL